MRRHLMIAMVFAGVLCPVLRGPVAHADETEAERNARAIADAQDEVTDAAVAIAEAADKLETISAELGTLQTEIAAIEADAGALRSQMEAIAIRRYTGASQSNSPLLSPWGSAEQQMQAEAYSGVIYDNSDQAFDEFDSTNRDLVAKQQSLVRTQQQVQQQTVDLAAMQERAKAKVEHLKQVEKQRLKDEATRRALAKEQARRAAQSASQASTSVGGNGRAASGGTVANAASGGQATVAVGNNKLYGTYVPGGGAAQGVKIGAGIGYPDLPFGAGGRATTTGVDWSGYSWVCPTGNAKTGFGHSFIPKTPGATYYHNGIDMAARLGTPLVAVEDGVAMPKILGDGGMTVFLVTSSGKLFYYAHLEAWGQMGRVAKGSIIGYAGMTGRAGGPHLHFEYHPGGIGSNAVDPYDLLRAHC